MKVKELLSDESKWTTGSNARNRTLKEVAIHSSEAVKWCLLGAVRKCYSAPECYEIENKIHDFIAPTEFMSYWNDHHTFEDVKKLVEELDI